MNLPTSFDVHALHLWRRRLNRAAELDEDPFDCAVAMENIVKAAKETRPAGDKDWS